MTHEPTSDNDPADWITSMVRYSEGAPSPQLFRKWAAIGAIAGALERRCWVTTAQSIMYPNMFILLVAPPAVGKSVAIDPIGELWKETNLLHVAPDSLTKASLMDSLEKAERKCMVGPPGQQSLMEYHSLQCCVSELGVLIPAHDLEFMSALNFLFDNRAFYREERRTNGRSIEIPKPQLTLLAGSQPGFMASLLPEEAWSMGFTSRMVMVYAGESPRVDLFDRPAPSTGSWPAIVKGLKAIVGLAGEFHFTAEAKQLLRDWYAAGLPPKPVHSKLEHYSARRIIYTLKLAMISAASRTCTMLIHDIDVERAKHWLLEAEALMPDIFRQMVGKSDSQTIQELHFFLFSIYARDKKPIPESVIFHFLSQHAPSDKIAKIIEIAERSNVLVKHIGPPGSPVTYSPRPKNMHGVE